MSSQIQQAGMLSGRSMTMMVVVGLHALAITALITYRMAPDADPGPATMPWTVFEDPDPPVPIEPARIFNSPDMIADTRIVIAAPAPIAEQALIAQLAPDNAGLPDPGPAPGGVPVETLHADTALQYQIVRPTADYYPNASLVQEEHGVSVVRVCVDAAGRIAGLPIIEAGSGYRRLDEAAIRWARESLRFTPATRDGAPVPACKGFRVNFKLR